MYNVLIHKELFNVAVVVSLLGVALLGAGGLTRLWTNLGCF